jgi:hypothetical protein
VRRRSPVAGGVVAGRLLVATAVVAAVSAAAPDLQAQTPLSTGGGVGAHLQSFHFTDDEAATLSSLSLLTVPVAVRVGVGGSVRIEASTTFARGELRRPDGASTSMGGLTDTRVQILTDLLDERVTVAGFVALPTGADRFTAEEAELAGAIAADLLPFRISSWGTGGGMGGSVSAFHYVGAFGMGLGAGYLASGEFTPVDAGSFQYRPGPALQIQALLDYTVGTAGRAALQLSHHRFGDDEVEGSNLFRSGDRTQVRASYSFQAGPGGSGVAWAGYLHRSEGAFLGELSTRPSQSLFFAGTAFRHPWRAMVAVPTGELRVQRRDDGRDQGTLGGIGLGLEIPRGGSVVVPAVQVRAGSVLISEGVRSGVLGVEAGVSVRYGGGR